MMSGDIAYRGWWIRYDPPPVPSRLHDWQYWSDEYDGPGDDRDGSASSLLAAREAIDERIEDEEAA